MIEAFVLSRFLVDFLWEYKFLSALQVILFAALTYVLNSKNRDSKLIIVKIDLIVALCFVCFLQSFVFQANDETLTTIIKITLFFLIYISGRVSEVSFANTRTLGFVCSSALLAFLLMGNLGYGYQVWGGALTYTGGYFFKTDLALAVCLLFVMILISMRSRFLLALHWGATMWIVLLTNARVFVPIVIVLPVINYLVRSHSVDSIALGKRWAKTFVLIGALSAFVLSAINLFSSDETYLTVSLIDFMSAENTQGRSVIWDALLVGFANADLLTQVFGGGLDADRLLVSGYAEISGVEDANSHSIYLYVLVSTGVLGVFLLSYLFVQLVFIFFIVKNSNEKVAKLKVMVASLVAILMVSGFTTDAIVRPQLMVLTSFVLGMLVQVYIKQRTESI